MKGFKAILVKECRHIIRDPKVLVAVLLMPVVLVLLFGYTIKNEINNARFAVLDNSKSVFSRQIINDISSSNYFSLKTIINDNSQIEKAFQSDNVRIVFVFPENFEENLKRNQKADIQMIVDASDLNVATTLVSYAQQILDKSIQDRHVAVQMQPIDVRVKMQYNPQLESAYMFIPGNIALIMVLVTTLMTSIAISKERERGTWRLLAITPSNQLMIVLGKIIPYMCISLICTVLVIVLGIVIFDMPMRGNVALLILLCFLFMLTACALGVLISVLTNTQQVAMLTCMLGFFLPTLLLSDFLFPIENMPVPLQILSHIFPAKWFILAMRDIMVKGAGFELVWLPVTILLGMTIVLLGLSVWKLSKKSV
ncbi:MAG: ABC transporter permease [Bacteroidales bacterium]|jgi:ABC-2 type transport system permease protein|nr:ABC transporter permease [Bacteroidales bacterium]MBO7346673.1 ABC transporter permease [Bacteroidales bacterium]MBR4453112.1 ABC transporter permease [Bacteroidales bacterium]MCR5555563.1 ABC transporter permease [Bacteroidales bacterium]